MQNAGVPLFGGRARAGSVARAAGTYLLHDAGLALGKGDVATRLVLDELDLDLPALAARLVVVIVVVVGGRARALGAAIGIGGVEGAVAVAVVVELRRRVLVVFGDLAGHRVARVSLVAGVWPWAVLTAFGRVFVGRPSASVWRRGAARNRTGLLQTVQCSCDLAGVGLGPGR
jgi:hypothetical protein